MKAIIFDRLLGSPVFLPPIFNMVPDSAITLPDMPVFLPDISSLWEVRAGLIFKIGRLGKNIAPKFTERYISAVSVAAQVVPVTLKQELASSGYASSLPYSFDGALNLGEWQAFDPEWSETSLRVDFGEHQSEVNVSRQALALEETLAAVSKYTTIKIGDVIMPAVCLPPITVNAGDIINFNLHGEKKLTLKIK